MKTNGNLYLPPVSSKELFIRHFITDSTGFTTLFIEHKGIFQILMIGRCYLMSPSQIVITVLVGDVVNTLMSKPKLNARFSMHSNWSGDKCQWRAYFKQRMRRGTADFDNISYAAMHAGRRCTVRCAVSAVAADKTYHSSCVTY